MTTISRGLSGGESVLARAAERLSAARLRQEIDLPIDEALSGSGLLSISAQALATSRAFNEHLTRLTQVILSQGSRLRSTPSRTAALAEAIELLNACYRTQSGHGYECALLDVTSGKAGAWEVVALDTVEAIKARERDLYRRWVLAELVEPLSWESRCAVAAAYLAAHGARQAGAPAPDQSHRFANCLPELIIGHVRAQDGAFAGLAVPEPLCIWPAG